jgi:hypothetical protein
VAKGKKKDDQTMSVSGATSYNFEQQLITKTTKATAYPDEATIQVGTPAVLKVTFNTEVSEPLVCEVSVAFERFKGKAQKALENHVPGFVKQQNVVKGANEGNTATFTFIEGLLEDMQKAGLRIARLVVDTQVMQPVQGPIVTQIVDVKVPANE